MRHGVPLLPCYHGADQNPARLLDEAERIGFPVLIKASAGGGGRGMRTVGSAAEFAAALAGAKREAEAAFGDDRVLVEALAEFLRDQVPACSGDAPGKPFDPEARSCSGPTS